MDYRDVEKIQELAKEGKMISRIWREDFPEYDYVEIYMAVYGGGEKSSLGVKRMITNRLNKLSTARQPERGEIIVEIKDLVWHLYDRYKKNQQKLEKVRKAIE